MFVYMSININPLDFTTVLMRIRQISRSIIFAWSVSLILSVLPLTSASAQMSLINPTTPTRQDSTKPINPDAQNAPTPTQDNPIQPTQTKSLQIEGTILDATTGETLPAASIAIKNTYRGTISNSEGRFTIQPDSLPATLIVRFIGYRMQELTLTTPPTQPLQIRLEPEILQMEEVVVTGEDPGLSIMEQVIARKQLWQARLFTYEADAYTRQRIENDTTIVSISESASVVYWDRTNGTRERQLYKNQTSNISEELNFAGVSFFPNFYADDIEISGFSLVGVTHPDALDFYRFSLLDVATQDGKLLYTIQVQPRRTLQPLFEGTLKVLDEEFALLEVDLKPNDVVRFPPPVQEFDLAYRQQFSNYGRDFWLPVDMNIDGSIKIGIIGLDFPLIRFRQVSQITDYRVNEPLPAGIFEQESPFITSYPRLSERPEEMRLPLSEEEQQAYATIDSTQTLDKAFQPTGFLARFTETSASGETQQDTSRTRGFQVSGILRYQRVDGATLGAKVELDRSRSPLKLSLSPVWHFNRGEAGIRAGARLALIDTQRERQRLRSRSSRSGRSGDDERDSDGTRRSDGTRSGDGEREYPFHLYLYADYTNDSENRWETATYPNLITSAVTAAGGQDYGDYYQKEAWAAELEALLPIPGRIRLAAGIQWEKHTSFDSELLQDWSLFGSHDPRRPNPRIDDGRLTSLTLRLGNTPEGRAGARPSGFGSQRAFEVRLEHSLSSTLAPEPHQPEPFSPPFQRPETLTFTKLDGEIRWSMPTFYQRRFFPNALHLTARAGITFGDLPLQRFDAIDGSLFQYSPFGVLKTRRHLPYEGDRYWLIAAEHDLQSILFERLKIRPLVDQGTGIILFATAGQSISKRRFLDYQPITSDGVHLEAGFSINRIAGIFRADVAFRMDQPGFFIGVSVPRYF